LLVVLPEPGRGGSGLGEEGDKGPPPAFLGLLVSSSSSKDGVVPLA